MKRLPLRLAMILTFLPSGAPADEGRVPVVVELFTSEGCSSCPPADELLSRLERSQPVPAAQIIALEEHVDYWNQLGWTDRFSSPQFRARQNDYARIFQTENVYTPQMVVNGVAGFGGDDSGRAVSEIGRAAANQNYVVRLKPEQNAKDSGTMDLIVVLRNARPGKPEPADVYLAITEARLSSNVQHGENAGRLLRHAPVVRSFGVIGNIDASPFREAGLKNTLKFPSDWKRENLRAVVFVQERGSHRITGAASIDLH